MLLFKVKTLEKANQTSEAYVTSLTGDSLILDQNANMHTIKFRLGQYTSRDIEAIFSVADVEACNRRMMGKLLGNVKCTTIGFGMVPVTSVSLPDDWIVWFFKALED